MDIRHFRTANALIDPTHDIAQDSLAIVVELSLNIARRPVRPADRYGKEIREKRRGSAGEHFPAARDIDSMVMYRVQHRGGR